MLFFSIVFELFLKTEHVDCSLANRLELRLRRVDKIQRAMWLDKLEPSLVVAISDGNAKVVTSDFDYHIPIERDHDVVGGIEPTYEFLNLLESCRHDCFGRLREQFLKAAHQPPFGIVCPVRGLATGNLLVG